MKTIESKEEEEEEEEEAVESSVVNHWWEGSVWTFQAASNAYSHLCPTRSFDGRNPQQAGRRRQDGKIRYVNTIEWLTYMNMLHSEQASAERLELLDESYLVSSPFLVFCWHWDAEKSINPFGRSMFRRGSPTTAALSPARAAGCASKAVPFLFLLFPNLLNVMSLSSRT